MRVYFENSITDSSRSQPSMTVYFSSANTDEVSVIPPIVYDYPIFTRIPNPAYIVKIPLQKIPGKSPRLPEYQTPGSAGADVCACLDVPVILNPGQTKTIPTGFRIAIPARYEAQIRPRSGLALKHSIGLMNSPGTIDSDYRGEVKIILTNFGKEDFKVENGDRIAQMIIAPVITGDFCFTEELEDTSRGGGGFGHTGK